MDDCLACELVKPVDAAFDTIFDFIDTLEKGREISKEQAEKIAFDLAWTRIDLHGMMKGVHGHE